MKIKPVHAATLLLSVSALWLPLVRIKANRVVRGDAYTVWDMLGAVAGGSHVLYAVLLACVVGPLLLMCAATVWVPSPVRAGRVSAGSEASRRAGSDRLLMLGGAGAFLLVLLVILGVGPRAAGWVTPTTRTGIEIGLWVALGGGYLALQQWHSAAPAEGDSTGRGGRHAWRVAVQLYVPSLLLLFIVTGLFDHLGILQEFYNNRQRFLQELTNHLFLSFLSVGGAVCIGVPLGVLAWRRRRCEHIIFPVVNAIQTIPSLALFGLIIAPLSLISQRFDFLRAIGIKGIGNTPALIALTLYALLPIIQNTYSGLANIPRPIIDAGQGMGMRRAQVWAFLERPLSFPILFTGIRTAAVQTIGNTTIAALIGAAGLGNFVFRGLGQAATDLILLGVIPIVTIAVIVNALFGAVIARMHVASGQARMAAAET